MRQVRNFREALQSAQIVDQGKQHHPNHQTDTDLNPPTLHPIRQGTTTRPLDQIKQQMPPIQYRDGQQIQNPQADTQISQEIQEISDARLGRSARHFSNGYRSTQVFYRELAEQHFLQRVQGQDTHGPSASSTFANRRQRPVTDLSNHLRRPVHRLDPGPQITARRLAFAAAGQGQRDVDLSTITLDVQHNFGIRTYTDPIHHLLPIVQGLVIHRQQAVAGLEAGSLGRALRIEFGQHRRQRRTPWANPQGLDRIGLIGALQPVVQRQFARRVGRRARLTDPQLQGAAFPQATHQLKIDRAPAGGRFAVDSNDFLTAAQAGLLGQAAAFHGTDDWTHLLAAEHRQAPEKHDSQEKVGNRAGGDDCNTLAHRLAVESLVEQLRRDFSLTLVEHFHVAAQRNRGNHELGALAIMPTQQRHAEAHGKTQDLDAATTGHPEVAEFVKGHQHTQGHQGADYHIERAHLLSPQSQVPTAPKATPDSSPVATQPLLGQSPGLGVCREYRVELVDRDHRLQV